MASDINPHDLKARGEQEVESRIALMSVADGMWSTPVATIGSGVLCRMVVVMDRSRQRDGVVIDAERMFDPVEMDHRHLDTKKARHGDAANRCDAP